jgi:hypothetical protein
MATEVVAPEIAIRDQCLRLARGSTSWPPLDAFGTPIF